MHTKAENINSLLQGELSSSKLIDLIFNNLERDLLDKREIILNFEKITFISVYFLERLETLVSRAKDLNVEIKILNVSESIYKVFHVARTKLVLETIR